VLLSRYDVFLLDEPTNDLDFAGLERLERFVLGLTAGLVVVSHDREFLARTVSDVLDIDEPSRTATLYAGGYDAYLAERALRRTRPGTRTRSSRTSGRPGRPGPAASASSPCAARCGPSARCRTTTGRPRAPGSRRPRTPPPG
jgi:energy-coupling factor transporter ATP-binding protein EcfA2